MRVVVVVTTRRARCTVRGAARRATWRCAGTRFTFTGLTWWISPFEGASETWTAPPPSIAPPAAQAISFTIAAFIDISLPSLFWRGSDSRAALTLPFTFPVFCKNADAGCSNNAVNRV